MSTVLILAIAETGLNSIVYLGLVSNERTGMNLYMYIKKEVEKNCKKLVTDRVPNYRSAN